MKNLSLFLIVFLLVSSSRMTHARDDYADLVLWNGKIITVDANDNIAQAVAVKGSLILAVGTNDEVKPFIGPETDTRNLNGRTVTPGMIDAHLHLMYYGQAENEFVNLRPPDVTSIEDALAKIEERITETAPGDWVIGDGFFKLEDMRLPTKWDIDAISPENPVFLNSMGGHYGSVNSKALQIAGIDSSTPDPVGGIIERDSLTGEPNGILWNHPAMDLVRRYFPPFDIEVLTEDVLFAQELCPPAGITSYQDVNTRSMARVLGYYNALDDLKSRAFLLFTIEKPRDADVSLANLQVYKGARLSLGGDKFLLDGQPPTSYTYEPHPGPSWNMGTWNPDTLISVVKKLHRAGHQLAFHCMGDHAIDLALDAIEAAQNDTFRVDHRHRLEHCMIPTEAAIDRMKELGVVVSLQPAVIYVSGQFYVGFWGTERIQRLKPMRTLLEKGIPVALGTDYPTVLSIAPKTTLWAACVRRSQTGHTIAPEERVTIQQALRAHTMGSAYAAFEDDVKGSIEVGKYADMVVWSDDLYSVPVEDINDLYVISTIIGGVIYNNPNVGVEHSYEASQPSRFTLLQNYPNPFNANTKITFETPHHSHVQIDILNIRGRFVKRAIDRLFPTGKHTITFDAQELPSGVYFIKMRTERFSTMRKMILLK